MSIYDMNRNGMGDFSEENREILVDDKKKDATTQQERPGEQLV